MSFLEENVVFCRIKFASLIKLTDKGKPPKRAGRKTMGLKQFTAMIARLPVAEKERSAAAGLFSWEGGAGVRITL